MTPNIQYKKILNILEVQLRELNNVKKSLMQIPAHLSTFSDKN